MVILSNASFHMYFLVSVLNRHVTYPTFLNPCMMPGTDLNEGGIKGRKKEQTDRHTHAGKLALGGLASQMVKPQDPESSECLLYTIKWGIRVIGHN